MSMPVHERRALERIAEQLAAEDPALHASFRRFAATHGGDRAHPTVTPAGRLARWAPAVVIATGVLVAVTGLALRRTDVALGGALLAACAPWLARPARRRPRA